MNQFLRQQGMRKEEVEREMERAYTQYFSSLAKKGRFLSIYPAIYLSYLSNYLMIRNGKGLFNTSQVWLKPIKIQ